MIHHVTRATKHLIFWSLVLTAIALTGIRLALTSVAHYKADLETRISVQVGTPVKLGKLSANMRGISPELVVKDIKFAPILVTESQPLHLQEIRFGINLGQFLLSRDSLSSSSITVVGATLKIIRNPDGNIIVEGLKAGNSQPLWLLQGRKYELLQSHITWQDKMKQARPVVMDNVNVAIINNGNKHRINALAKTPESLGDGITAVLDFTGDVDKPLGIKGNLFVKCDQLKLQEMLSPYMPAELGLTSGIGDISIWGQWQSGSLVSAQSEMRLHDTVFTKKNNDSFHIVNLDTQIKWQSKVNEWQVDVGRFLLESPGANKKTPKKWPDAQLSVAAENGAETPIKQLKLYVKQLDLAEATTIAQFFAPETEALQNRINQLTASQLNGVLKDFSAYAQPEHNDIALAGWFDAVSFEPVQAIPGLTNISGEIKGVNQYGKLALTGKDSYVKSPALFSKPVKLNKINGTLNWRHTGDEWRLTSPSLEVNSPAFNSESRLMVGVPDSDAKPFIDIQIAFKSDDLSQLAGYMPTQIMKEKQKTWLTNAFLGGKATNGSFLFYGKAGDFPFTDGTGVLEGSVDVVDAGLDFHPQWAKISGINGTVSFAQNNIEGHFNRGLIEKSLINKADLLISGLGGKPMLSIKGEAQGEVNHALSILQNSPLAERINPLLTGFTVQGDTNVALNLEIPLHPNEELKVTGKAQLVNNLINVNRLGLKITGVNGDLNFNNTGIFGEKIQAVTLGHPIQVAITQEEQHTLVDVSGKASVAAVETLFNLPDANVAEGDSDYLLELKIPKIVDANNPFDISVKSALEGVSLNVPGILVKTKGQAKPTIFRVKLTDQEALPIEFDFNNELKAAVSLNAKERKVNSGHILIGKGDVHQRKIPGIKLEVSQEHLALQDWLDLAASQKAGTTHADINEIKIHSQSAYWQKTRIGAFDLALKRNERSWAGDIDSAFGKGEFQLPLETTGNIPVVLDMDTINLTALKQLKLQEGAVNNNRLKPLININSKKTLWRSEDLGTLALQTERTPNGIKIKKLNLIGQDEKLFMTGNWRETGINSITHVSGKLVMNKADELFDRLNITKDLTGTSGEFDFKLNWNAPPWHVSMPTLKGSLDAKLKDGRILSIEPGFGRLLGMIAVAQWIKRLQLDFSDVYEEGLSFNSIKGHFDVLNGNAHSKDLVIDAVPATITISGDTNLVKQTVDHVIDVVPKSLDALPIAGTIVSKITSVVGKTLTGEDPEGFFFGKQYLVKGSWNDIKISQSYENDGLIQKTWRGITEFPWDEDPK
ncbi:hypothetical protein MCAMS1_02121 [biofilm metagenome]